MNYAEFGEVLAVARICQLPQEEVCWHCLSTDWVRQGYVASGESARTCGRCCDGSQWELGELGTTRQECLHNGGERAIGLRLWDPWRLRSRVYVPVV